MADTYTTVTHRSWLDNIIGSFVGAGIGVLLFLGALGLIWYAEGRTNLALVAKESIPAAAERIDPANGGKLVAVTGQVTGAPLGDPQFLASGPYLRLQRHVEMYAWVEEKRTERKDEVGGGTTERTTYTYTKRWTSSPESGDGFYQPSGHRNPPLQIEGAELSASEGSVGAYALDLKELGLPSGDELPLTEANVRAGGQWRLDDGYIFSGRGRPSSPQIGDVRVSYTAVPDGLQATVFGEQRGEGLAPFRTEQGDVFYRALAGDRAAAIDQLSFEDTLFDWIFRLGSLLMLWVGLAMVLGPINAILGVLPAVKRASGCLTGLVAFVPAFVVWALAELVAIVAHNIWLLLGAVVIAVVLAVVAGRRFLPAARAAVAAS